MIIGPKMYIATADSSREGSTRLHVDVTCAVNILCWTSAGSVAPAAEWHIFEPQDLDRLRAYLRSKGVSSDDVDPVHAQQTYLTEAMLAELRVLGVRPYIIKQCLGDAVFIPAGAAHQVRSLSVYGCCLLN